MNRPGRYVWIAAIGLIGSAIFAMSSNQARADQVFRQCDDDGDQCRYFECDRDGDECHPVSEPNYSQPDYYQQRRYYQPPALSFSWGFGGGDAYYSHSHREDDDDEE